MGGSGDNPNRADELPAFTVRDSWGLNRASPMVYMEMRFTTLYYASLLWGASIMEFGIETPRRPSRREMCEIGGLCGISR